MEQRDKIRLTTTSTFVLEREEIKRLYIYLSLFQYSWLRAPDYDEQLLLKTLKKDFKKCYVEMQKQSEQDPNNLTLNKIRTFFDMHYNQLLKLTDESPQV